MTQTTYSQKISVAPMMDCTDKHDRYFLRLIAPDVLLYSEMITAQAITHGDVQKLLSFHPSESPVALQLGGSDPAMLAKSAVMGENFGYDEINLNVGCPSDRVQSGRFGACLMLEPNLVADCLIAMQSRVKLPVTVKCRIGVDDQDSYESLHHFIKLIAATGCKTFIIHARKAWLKGLSPKQNRDIPPLCYPIVWKIKQDFPNLTIIINGSIKTKQDIDEQLQHVDGVMIGRAAYSNPYLLADFQETYYPRKTTLSRAEVVERFIPYVAEQLSKSTKLSAITRHILGIFQGQPGAAAWRRYISQYAHRPGAGVEVIQNALALLTS